MPDEGNFLYNGPKIRREISLNGTINCAQLMSSVVRKVEQVWSIDIAMSHVESITDDGHAVEKVNRGWKSRHNRYRRNDRKEWESWEDFIKTWSGDNVVVDSSERKSHRDDRRLPTRTSKWKENNGRWRSAIFERSGKNAEGWCCARLSSRRV